MSNIIVTNTPNVEGYVITDYLGSVSGAATYLLGGAFGEGLSDSRQSAMVSNAFQTAIRQMKTEARGADAIVGLQHTLCGVSNGYMIVSVTGTAVKLATEEAYTEIRARRQRELERQLEQQRVQEARQLEEAEAHRREWEEHQAQLRQEIDVMMQRADAPDLSGLDADQRESLKDDLRYVLNLVSVVRGKARLKALDQRLNLPLLQTMIALPDEQFKPFCRKLLDQLEQAEG